ncbi:TetR family transcriptional regulator [Actinoplanes sp. NBRC 103695]|uniref:TetR/AcrR family transcriptional regulator n=1 Tax=Actinoplanes sp. NBRC 103695 TaxID=3032202 RepID=UPI0024A4A948|nr:TetR family transcriptional regulator [Actinoplanes sp. NBRC 103695]GLY94879.1 hypothetical protein Acsp02_21340 [Actinoplanes sp. NBRC 103695]
MTRAQQRQQTEARILAAARRLFADLGYDRTTIRAVAAAAGVDAGLVMHYFKSKDALFAHATDQTPAEPSAGARPASQTSATAHAGQLPATAHAGQPPATAHAGQPPASQPLIAGPADQLPAAGPASAEGTVASPAPAEALLTSLADRLVSEPASSLAVLRSMLTNPDAADRYRAAAEAQLSGIIAGIPTADADLRAGLLGAIVHGVIIERYLLRLGPLADAPPDQIIDLLRPCFEALAATPAD